MSLKDKTIILGISGGIAAYKTVDLVSQMTKLGADVHVICTDNALNFVSKLSLETMSRNKVHSEQYSDHDAYIDHINLADSADLILLAPATANTIGKLASGISDNLLLDTCLASKAKKLIAPAMNTNMWENPAVRKNIGILTTELGMEIIDPDSGELACGHVGEGRLAELDKIINRCAELLDGVAPKQTTGTRASNNKAPAKLASDLEIKSSVAVSGFTPFKGKKFIVTAGGTKEPIDPVRFISNRSSGKMGFAMADVAYSLGAEVILVTTVPIEKPYRVIRVETASEMQSELEKEFTDTSVLIMAAAVADYKSKKVSASKIKKSPANKTLNVEFARNDDILANLSQAKDPEQVIVGFALETEDHVERAKQKLKDKDLDMIVANSPSAFSSEENEVTIIVNDGSQVHLEKQAKSSIAKVILHQISELVEAKSTGFTTRELI